MSLGFLLPNIPMDMHPASDSDSGKWLGETFRRIRVVGFGVHGGAEGDSAPIGELVAVRAAVVEPDGDTDPDGTFTHDDQIAILPAEY